MTTRVTGYDFVERGARLQWVLGGAFAGTGGRGLYYYFGSRSMSI